MSNPEPPKLGWMIRVGAGNSVAIMIAVSAVDKFVIRGESISAGYLEALAVAAVLTGTATASLIAAAFHFSGLGRR